MSDLMFKLDGDSTHYTDNLRKSDVYGKRMYLKRYFIYFNINLKIQKDLNLFTLLYEIGSYTSVLFGLPSVTNIR
jgi:transposase-like protein